MNNCCRIVGNISGGQQINGVLNGGQSISGGLNVGVLNVKSVFQYETKFEFPTVGDSNALYIATQENASYRWNESDLHYYCVGRDYLELKIINGGNADGAQSINS